jgi:hypothetical protein
VHRVIEGSTHDSLLDADSAGPVQAILDVVDAVKTGSPVH